MRLAVDAVDLLARAQIVGRLPRPCGWHAIGDPLTSSTTVEAQHQPGSCERAAMVDRVNAKAAPVTDEARVLRLLVIKARPPHQRPVAEDPQIVPATRHFRAACRTHRDAARNQRQQYLDRPR